MANYIKEQWNAKKEDIMEGYYDCFAENRLHGTGIRVCVHYALFEDEFYLKSQIEVLKVGCCYRIS